MILSALEGYHRRLAAKGETAPWGYSLERVSFALVLSRSGELLDEPIDLRRDGREGPGLRPRRLHVPRPPRRTAGIASCFLWDRASYVLGVGDGPRTARQHAAFRRLHVRALVGSEDEGLRALFDFLGRWSPALAGTFANRGALIGANLVFRLEGDDGFVHDRPAARLLWQRMLARQGQPERPCLATGHTAPLARLHPAIKGVRGAPSTGAALVSCNLDAFTSYGKRQGDNAPISQTAAFACGAALEHLLREGSRNRVQIGDISTVFWAESDAPEEERFLGALFEPPVLPAGMAAAGTALLRDSLVGLAKGRPPSGLEPATRFVILGLAANGSRLVVRFWHADTLGELARRLTEHAADLRIEPQPWRGALPAIRRLLRETAARGKPGNIPPHLAADLMRAIQGGHPYPRALLGAVIARLRVAGPSGLRAAICKACVCRELRARGADPGEGVPVSRDESNPHPAYHLGRLLAVLEAAQGSAVPGLAGTMRERYYAGASMAPRRVFPLLLRLHGHHLRTLRSRRGRGLVTWYQKRVGAIMTELPTPLPTRLDLEGQGRFAVGYYHERESIYRRNDTGVPAELVDADLEALADDPEHPINHQGLGGCDR
jgi:CRISPR-associated protein Csd1